MDAEDASGYQEPCAQCSEVNWGISEEGNYYCRCCHNLIQRSRDVVDPGLDRSANRVSQLKKGTRTTQEERGHVWMVCEAFQFILMNQADTLVRLGVSPLFKDQVLCGLWRRYLQKSHLAFTDRPMRNSRINKGGADSDSDSIFESLSHSEIMTDGESNPLSVAGSNAGSSCDMSGSVDAATYLQSRKRHRRGLLTMRKTLVLIYVALVWSREGLTLSDLLRLARDGHVPYINAYEELPEQMKLTGRDAILFGVERIPSYRLVHKEVQSMIGILQLPSFPPISRQTLLHPASLTLRYLTDANLPDQLHPWVCSLMERANMADQSQHTFHPSSLPFLPPYDLQAAALIVVTMKVIFGLDDHTEWDLANQVQEKGDSFSLRRWYRLVQAALLRAQQRASRSISKKQWRPKAPITWKKDRCWVVKRRRISQQLQSCFQNLSSSQTGPSDQEPSSFTFCWGNQDGPSMHHLKLDSVLTQKGAQLKPSNTSFWHLPLQPCESGRCRQNHFLVEAESSLPLCFHWLLQLFGFMLNVKPDAVLQEVLNVERRIFGCKTPCDTEPGRTRTRLSQKDRAHTKK